MLHKAIKGFEDYLITDTGRVYSLKSERYLKHRYDKDGYDTAVLSKNGIQQTKRIHRLVAEAFIPNPENKATVDHINRIRDDNRLQNLRWASISENSKNRNNEPRIKTQRKQRSTAVIQVINDEVSIGYPSMQATRKYTSVQRHIVDKNQSDFTIKSRDGQIRRFKTEKRG